MLRKAYACSHWHRYTESFLCIFGVDHPCMQCKWQWAFLYIWKHGQHVHGQLHSLGVVFLTLWRRWLLCVSHAWLSHGHWSCKGTKNYVLSVHMIYNGKRNTPWAVVLSFSWGDKWILLNGKMQSSLLLHTKRAQSAQTLQYTKDHNTIKPPRNIWKAEIMSRATQKKQCINLYDLANQASFLPDSSLGKLACVHSDTGKGRSAWTLHFTNMKQ